MIPSWRLENVEDILANKEITSRYVKEPRGRKTDGKSIYFFQSEHSWIENNFSKIGQVPGSLTYNKGIKDGELSFKVGKYTSPSVGGANGKQPSQKGQHQKPAKKEKYSNKNWRPLRAARQ